MGVIQAPSDDPQLIANEKVTEHAKTSNLSGACLECPPRETLPPPNVSDRKDDIVGAESFTECLVPRHDVRRECIVTYSCERHGNSISADDFTAGILRAFEHLSQRAVRDVFP